MTTITRSSKLDACVVLPTTWIRLRPCRRSSHSSRPTPSRTFARRKSCSSRCDEARPLLVETLLDHQRLHALVHRLEASEDVRASMRVDDEERELGQGDAVIVAKGRRRRITAGRAGVRYLSVHLRRPPLQIQSAAELSRPA